MKRFLVSLGIAQFLFAGSALAAGCPSGEVGSILGLQPVSSHYTKRVIQRAENGLSYALSAGSESLDLPFFFMRWLDQIVTALTALVDTDIRVSREQINFREYSPCLFVDLLLIEAQMEKVRCELSNAKISQSSVRPLTIGRLKALLQFLDERYRHLTYGALDPTYVDTDWHQQELFDDPTTVWCSIMYAPDGQNYRCEQLPESKCWEEGGAATFDTETACLESLGFSPDNVNQDDAQRMCPFHTDYSPPTSYGYGCDLSILDKYKSSPAVTDEHKSLEKLVEKRNEFIRNVQSLKQLTIDLYQFMDREPPDLDNFGMALNVNHKSVTGCIDQVDRPVVRTRKKQKNVMFQKGAARKELRGPFNIEIDEMKIWREFLEFRKEWGRGREFADNIKLPGEFETQAQRDAAEKEDEKLAFHSRAVRAAGRIYMAFWNREQAARESASIGKSFDVPLDVSLEFEELQNEVKDMALIATDGELGARNFTRKYAWFLRASCIFRPCNMQLDNVLKIVLQEACFPYSKGAVLPEGHEPKKELDNSAEIACKAAAKLFCLGGGEMRMRTGTVQTPEGVTSTPVFTCQ